MSRNCQTITMRPVLLAGNQTMVPAPVMTDYSLYPRRRRLGGHTHAVYHIVFVIEGRGILDHSCGHVVMNPGDILVIDPDEKHIFETAQQPVRVFAFNFYLIPLAVCGSGGVPVTDSGGDIMWLEKHAVRQPLAALFGLRAGSAHLEYEGGTRVWERCMELVTELHETVNEYVVSDEPRVRTNGYPGYVYQSSLFLLRLVALLTPERCVPSGDPRLRDDRLVRAVDRYLREHLSDRYRLDVLAVHLGYAPTYLCTRFTHCLGMTIGDYHHRLRIQEACKRLRDGADSITRIALDLGYSSPQHFSAVFRRFRNVTPRQYRRQAEVF